jgi:hypothetical protein
VDLHSLPDPVHLILAVVHAQNENLSLLETARMKLVEKA